MNTINALEITNLVKKYDNNFLALKGIDLKVEQGDFFALLGPNGAGKSTTIGIIASLVNKTSGTVKVMGYDVDTQSEMAKTHLGIVPQEFNFGVFEKVIDIVVNSAGFYGVPRKVAFERAEKYLTQLGLWEKRNQISRTLSGGMKRRLMIARALMHEPELLILDEPTAGVDVELRRTMWDFIKKINKEEGKTIILTTHYLEEAESLCKKIAIIDHGGIIENTTVKSLLNKLNKQSYIFETKQEVKDLPGFENCKIEVLDSNTLEVTILQGESINTVFTNLAATGIDVVTMRNKENRLESLFVDMISGNY